MLKDGIWRDAIADIFSKTELVIVSEVEKTHVDELELRALCRRCAQVMKRRIVG
jgi:hypothetical protein